MRLARWVLAGAVAGWASGCGAARAPEVDAGVGGMDSGSAPDAGGGAGGGGDGGTLDAGTADAGAPDSGMGGGGPQARCQESAQRISCTHRTLTFRPGNTAREVHFEVPVGQAPAAGWPTVFLFQGSFFSAELTWDATPQLPFGAYFQTQMVARLLEAGFAVVTPEARLDGSTYWDTNQPLYANAWTDAPDHQLMLELFAALARGDFGPLDGSRLFAAGISSGGYMSSRMALSYAGRFRALAIASASWATCGGALCTVPAVLPADHPPTLFMHGELDLTVPISTMRPYAAALRAQGAGVKVVTDANAGHRWLSTAPLEVRDWFAANKQ